MNETKQVPITEDEAFDNKINFLGRWTSILAILAMLMVPCVVTLVFEIQVNLSQAIPIAVLVVVLLLCVLIIVRHKKNIVRLLKGEENRFHFTAKQRERAQTR